MSTDPGAGVSPPPAPGTGPTGSTPPPSTPPPSTPPPSTPPAAAPAATPDTSERLQALLAQAVEGQRDEQREITGVLAELRNQMLRLGQEIAELRSQPAHDDSSDAAMNAVTVELREVVRFLNERLDGVARMVAQRGEELADVRTGLGTIDQHVRSQAETIGVLSQGLQSLPSYGERVSALQENIDDLHERLGGIEGHLANVLGADVVGRLSGLEQALAPLHGQLTQLDAQLSQVGTAHGEHAIALTALGERLDGLAASAGSQEPSVDPADIARIDVRLTAIAEDLTALGTEVTELGETAARNAPAPQPDLGPDLDRRFAETEQRLRAHVDEAILALAEALLRRRPASTAGHITGTPVAASPDPGWAPPAADAPDELDDVAELDDADLDDADLDDDADGDSATAVDVDRAPVAPLEALGGHTAPAPVPAESPAVDEQPPSAPAGVAGGWSPEVPPERADANDPTSATVVPDRKHWWNRKEE